MNLLKSFICFTLLTASAIVAEAQGRLYVGGGAGFTAAVNTGSNLINASVNPEIGYSLSDRINVGVRGQIGFTLVKNGESSRKLGNLTLTSTDDIFIGTIAPYFRYRLFEWGPIGIWGEGNIMMGMAGGSKAFAVNFEMNALPLLMYAISDRATIFTAIDCFKYNLGNTSYFYNDYSNYSSMFNILKDGGSVIDFDNLTVGIIYNLGR